MLSLETPRDARRLYRTTREFIAFHSEGCVPVYVDEGAVVFAEPEKWVKWKWNGRESLQFFWERKAYHVDWKTFTSATETLEQ